jgi:hypothetical protein
VKGRLRIYLNADRHTIYPKGVQQDFSVRVRVATASGGHSFKVALAAGAPSPK